MQSWPDRLLASYAGDTAPEPRSSLAPLGDYILNQHPALTGAAIELLLDAAALPWRGQMAQGTPPFAILATALPVNASERDTLAARAAAAQR